MQDNIYNITIAGSGYVGMSLAVLLSKDNSVKVIDIDKNKVNLINQKKSTIVDKDIDKALASNSLNLNATTIAKNAYKNADYIIIATPTDFDEKTNKFDTSSVEDVIEKALEYNNQALIIIKSTVQVGFTKLMQKKFNSSKIVFSPEFLREGKALYDNLHPSRVVMGCKSHQAKLFVNTLCKSAIKKNIKKIFVNSTEAEAIKLFSNTYLAMRVAFFNELDSYSYVNNLNVNEIIKAVSLDERIGEGYNNPSFGYGGYCLPKDTKQLLANYQHIPQTLIRAIVTSNDTRIQFIANEIKNKNPKTLGFYRLVMKTDSDNLRSSSIIQVLKSLLPAKMEILIYEPIASDLQIEGVNLIKDLKYFKEYCDLIVANRVDNNISDVIDKCFSRDVFGTN